MSNTNEILKILENYFIYIKKGKSQSIKELINYFNGTSKMLSKNIHVKFDVNNFLAILDFEECSFYIQIDAPYGNFRVKTLKITKGKKEDLVKKGRADKMPFDDEGEMTEIDSKNLI